jgi:hypothetical protein
MDDPEPTAAKRPGRKFKRVVGPEDGYERPAAAELVTKLRTLIGLRYDSLREFHEALAASGNINLSYQELSRQLSATRFPDGPDQHIALAIVQVCDPQEENTVKRLYRAARHDTFGSAEATPREETEAEPRSSPPAPSSVPQNDERPSIPFLERLLRAALPLKAFVVSILLILLVALLAWFFVLEPAIMLASPPVPTVAPPGYEPVVYPNGSTRLVSLKLDPAAGTAPSDAPVVVPLVDKYFTAINTHDYDLWLSILDKKYIKLGADTPSNKTQWLGIYKSTRAEQVVINSVSYSESTSLEMDVSLSWVTTQKLEDAPPGVQSTRICWQSTWPISEERDPPYGWLISPPKVADTTARAC